MALTVAQGFAELLSRLTPTAAEKSAAASHRTSVVASLERSLPVHATFQTGSFHHGTGVRFFSDIDMFATITATKPTTDTALSWVRTALQQTFPYTEIRISRPAVVIKFNGGRETWEVIPAFYRSGDTYPVYDIPGFGEWISASPTAHLDYVDGINNTQGLSQGAKKLARFAKAWKYYNSVPVSSFYLEMRAAEYMKQQSYFDAALDTYYFLRFMYDRELAAMNDPLRLTSRINATSSATTHADALSKLGTATAYAKKATDASLAGNIDLAFYYWSLVFGGCFPAR